MEERRGVGRPNTYGIIYKEERPTFEEQLPALNKGPLVRQKIEPRQVEGLLNEFL